jgi:hypothetical protein
VRWRDEKKALLEVFIHYLGMAEDALGRYDKNEIQRCFRLLASTFSIDLGRQKKAFRGLLSEPDCRWILWRHIVKMAHFHMRHSTFYTKLGMPTRQWSVLFSICTHGLMLLVQEGFMSKEEQNNVLDDIFLKRKQFEERGGQYGDT